MPAHFQQAESEADEAAQRKAIADHPDPQPKPNGAHEDPSTLTKSLGNPALNQDGVLGMPLIPTAADTPANDLRDDNTWMMPEEFQAAHPKDTFNPRLQNRPTSGALMSAHNTAVFRQGIPFSDILNTQIYADAKFAPGQDLLTGSQIRSEPHAGRPTTKPQYTSNQGVADGSTKQKPAYQLQQENSDPQGLPRVEGKGHMVSDRTANDGRGGYRIRAPDQAAANQAAENNNINAEARAYNLNPDDPQFKDDPASLEAAVAIVRNRAKTKGAVAWSVPIPLPIKAIASPKWSLYF